VHFLASINGTDWPKQNHKRNKLECHWTKIPSHVEVIARTNDSTASLHDTIGARSALRLVVYRHRHCCFLSLSLMAMLRTTVRSQRSQHYRCSLSQVQLGRFLCSISVGVQPCFAEVVGRNCTKLVQQRCVWMMRGLPTGSPTGLCLSRFLSVCFLSLRHLPWLRQTAIATGASRSCQMRKICSSLPTALFAPEQARKGGDCEVYACCLCSCFSSPRQPTSYRRFLLLRLSRRRMLLVLALGLALPPRDSSFPPWRSLRPLLNRSCRRLQGQRHRM